MGFNLSLQASPKALHAVMEAKGMRTLKSRTYILEDGTFRTEIYPYAIFENDGRGGFTVLSDTNSVSEGLEGSPHSFIPDTSNNTYYEEATGMRVGRSDVTKNGGSLWQTLHNPSYSNVRYRAYSVWDISAVGNSNYMDWGVNILSTSFSASLSYVFRNENWFQTVYLKYGDIIPQLSYAEQNYNAIGNASVLADTNVVGDIYGNTMGITFENETDGNTGFDSYIEQLRLSGGDELDLLFQAGNEYSDYFLNIDNGDTIGYWDYSV